MPTNNIKHYMLKLAREFASRKFYGYILTVDNDDSSQDFVDISASQEEKEVLESILNNHPEFDSGEFRKMIREFQVRNKMNKENERE